MGTKYKHLLFACFAAIFVAFSLNISLDSGIVYADHPGDCTPQEKTDGAVEETTNGVVMCKTTGNGTGGANQAGGAVAPDSNDDLTCAIEKIGWVLCPVVEWGGKIGDGAFQMLASHFLETEPELVASITPGGAPSGTYIAWELARNIANIMFVIAFLIIIYSQVTGAGLNNYGIKKMLPRLIIAVIAVNASYYICQLMVDLTNILGYTIKDFLVQTSVEISDRAAMPPAAANQSISQTSSSGTLTAIVLAVIGIAAVATLLLPMLGVSVLAIVIACLAIVVILLMRKAFIVLLVVMSPIAFVAYLLPNTERYFKKWGTMFWQLLLVFPVIALLFGGGQLASAVVLIAGTNRGVDAAANNTRSVYEDGGEKCVTLPLADAPAGSTARDAVVGTCGTGSTPAMLGLTAAVIAIAPLFAVWSVLKGALSAAGSIGGKIGGTITSIGDKAGRGGKRGEDWAKKAAGRAIGTRAMERQWRGTRPIRNFQKRGELSKKRFENAQKGFDHSGSTGDIQDKIEALNMVGSGQQTAATKEFMDKVAKGDVNLAKMAGGAYAAPGVAEAIATQQKRAMDEVIKGIKEGFKSTNVADMKADFIAAASSGDKLRAKAMLDLMAGSGSAGINAIHEGYGTAGIAAGSDMDRQLRERIQTDNSGAKNSDASIKAWADGDGTASLTDHFNSPDTWVNELDQLDKFTRMSGSIQRHAYTRMSTTPNGQAHIDFLKGQINASPTARSSVDKTVLSNMGFH